MTQASPAGPEQPTWRITPHATSVPRYCADLWRARRLFPYIMLHAVKQTYSAAILGWGWLFVRPFIMAVAATIVVGGILGVSTAPVPYLLFVLVSISNWLFFQRGMAWCTRGIQQHGRLLRQFRFPHLIVQISAIMPAVVEYGVVLMSAMAAAVYFALAGEQSIEISWRLLAVFPALLMTACLVIGITSITGLWNSAARDVWYTSRYVLNAWVLLTPVYYPLSAVPQPYRDYMLYNPMTPVLELYRWALLPGQQMRWDVLAVSAGVIAVILLIGLTYFVKRAPRWLDMA